MLNLVWSAMGASLARVSSSHTFSGGNALRLPRRQFLHLAAGAAALPVISRTARAQSYPTRPARIIVPFAPGGGIDIVARLIGQWLSERLGKQFLIENRPGGGGNIATEAGVRAAPHGPNPLPVTPGKPVQCNPFR